MDWIKRFRHIMQTALIINSKNKDEWVSRPNQMRIIPFSKDKIITRVL